MKRNCIIVQDSNYYHSPLKRCVCIDYDNQEMIFNFLEENEKKMKIVFEKILSHNLLYSDHYGREDINEKCKNVTAMKFFKGKNNPRIYCQELKNTITGTLYIICSELLDKKKSMKNNNEINAIITKVSNYEYTII